MRLFASNVWTAASVWDRIGISLSGLCAIHCVLTPLLLIALPFSPLIGALHDWLHPVLIVLIVPIVALAYRHTPAGPDRRVIVGFFAAGLVTITTAWLSHDLIGAWGEASLTLAGSLLLITGHWKNARCHHRCDECTSAPAHAPHDISPAEPAAADTQDADGGPSAPPVRSPRRAPVLEPDAS